MINKNYFNQQYLFKLLIITLCIASMNPLTDILAGECPREQNGKVTPFLEEGANLFENNYLTENKNNALESFKKI